MSDILPREDPTTSGQVTQLDDVHSDDVIFKVAVVLAIGLVIVCFWWLFKPRSGDPKNKLKLPLTRFRSLFKYEWTWRFFTVLQIAGLIGIIYLATNNPDWHLFPHDYPDDYHTDGPYWDYLNSRYWTDDHENWFITAFLFGPFLLTRALDWIFEAKKKSPLRGNWKNN